MGCIPARMLGKSVIECKDWQDDKRMSVLFSPFRKKELNPVDYESKLNFWKDAIEGRCFAINSPILTQSSVQSTFKRKNQSPACLATVFDELTKSGELKLKSDFLNTNPDETWTSWAINSFVKTPAVWSMSKLKEALVTSEQRPQDVEYVLVKFLQVRSDEALSEAVARDSPLLTMDQFAGLLGSKDEQTTSLVLHWLRLKRKAVVIEVKHQKLIKLGKEPTISDSEISLFTIQETIQKVQQMIDLLENTREKAFNDAKAYVASGKRMAARQALRNKKELEKQIQKKMSVLDNLELLQCRIKDAKSDAHVFEAYKMGYNAVGKVLEENGMDADSVEDALFVIQEINNVYSDVQAALSQPVASYDEDELESELQSILREKPLEPEVPVLPEVPNNSPVKIRPIDADDATEKVLTTN